MIDAQITRGVDHIKNAENNQSTKQFDNNCFSIFKFETKAPEPKKEM
jgi:hypothetical protein